MERIILMVIRLIYKVPEWWFKICRYGKDENFEKYSEEKRDYIDEHREESPLKRTEDAVLIDNSNMTIEEEVQVMMAVIEKKKC